MTPDPRSPGREDPPSAQRVLSPRILLAGLLPLVLVGALTWLFLAGGASWLASGRIPVEKLTIERVLFRPQEIVLRVRNEGAAPASIGQVLVNEAIWDFSITPGRTLGRLGGATISIPYDWQDGEPYEFTIVSGTGLRHTKTIDVAIETPRVAPRSILLFGGLGAYVGVIPVFLGLLWLPFLRAMPRVWMDFWISLTLGLLLFLGIDTLKDSIEILGRVPSFWNGFLLTSLGTIGAFLLLTGAGRSLGKRGDPERGPVSGQSLAMLIALGIGLHNLGEGLAIGAAYTLGEMALGSFLIVGFTLHNTTEGLAILSPLVDGGAVRLRTLALLGLIGGGPTILGAWIGAFTDSAPLALFFLGVGAGAIFQVVRVLARSRAERGESVVEALSRPRNLSGLLVGFLLMYATSLLIAG